jgi:hypothetical protein
LLLLTLLLLPVLLGMELRAGLRMLGEGRRQQQKRCQTAHDSGPSQHSFSLRQFELTYNSLALTENFLRYIQQSWQRTLLAGCGKSVFRAEVSPQRLKPALKSSRLSQR